MTRGPVRGGPVKFALIGTGDMGNGHLSQYQKEFLDLKALCDINPKRRAAAVDKMVKKGWPKPNEYEDWREMLQKEDLEAVQIATPLWTHSEITVGCLNAGKHVLCEKMMAKSEAECQAMIDASVKNKKVLEIGYQRYYNPIYQAAYTNIIKAGLLGDVYHARLAWHRNSTWRKKEEAPSANFDPSKYGYPDWDHLLNWRMYKKYSEGLLCELGSHQITATSWFLIRRRKLSIPPAAHSGLRMAARFMITSSPLSLPGRSDSTFSSIQSNAFEDAYEMYMGTKGTLILTHEVDAYLFTEGDGAAAPSTKVEVSKQGSGPVADSSASRPIDSPGRTVEAQGGANQGGGVERNSSYKNEIAEFCAAVRTGSPIRCGPEKAMKSALAILTGNRSGEQQAKLSIPKTGGCQARKVSVSPEHLQVNASRSAQQFYSNISWSCIDDQRLYGSRSLGIESMSKEFKYVKYLWQDEAADQLTGLHRLVYRSNKLGEDLTLTNTGGGNTSSKLLQTDPLTGEEVQVLWVKGSGGDLRTAKADGFASLYLEKIRAMKPLYLNHPERGPKTKIEDDMYPMYSHCVFNLNHAPAHRYAAALWSLTSMSIIHPNAVIAIAASVNQEKLCQEIYGDDVIYVPWQRPGFDIGLLIEKLIADHPNAKGVLLGHHGMSSWSNDDKTCYETALEIIDRAATFIESHDRGEKTFGGVRYAPLPEPDRLRVLAELLPWLRGQVSVYKRFVGTVQYDERMRLCQQILMVHSLSWARPARTTSCEQRSPLFVDQEPASRNVDALKEALTASLIGTVDYEVYYERCKHPDSPAMRIPIRLWC